MILRQENMCIIDNKFEELDQEFHRTNYILQGLQDLLSKSRDKEQEKAFIDVIQEKVTKLQCMVNSIDTYLCEVREDQARGETEYEYPL